MEKKTSREEVNT